MRTRIFGFLLTSIAAVAAYAATPPAHVSYTVAPTWKSGTYAYDAAGNIIAIGGDRYVYDELNRLYDASLEEALDRKGQRYTYDAFGNLTKVEYTANGAVTRARAQNVDPNLTNQLTNVVDNGTTTAFTYDAAGNVQRAGSVQYTYDAAGTMTGVAASQQSEFYVYTADGERIASVDLAVGNPGSWTMVHWRLRDLGAHVVRELDEYPSNGTWTWSRDYVYRGGSLLSSFVNNGTSEARQDYHLDHLGSPRLITDEQGYRVAQHDFFPYGEEVNPPPLDSDALKFTGHERDTGTSSDPTPANYLDYMHARYYGTVSGRFLSVDPVIDVKKSVGNSQTWNRYAYVSNNPINKNDPDGRDEFLLTWKQTKDSVGHSATAVQNRDSNGNPTGTVTVRELWPAGSVGKNQTVVKGEYLTTVIPEAKVSQYASKLGRPADGVIRVKGDAKQDALFTAGLSAAAKANPFYAVPSWVCTNYANAGFSAIGLPATKTGVVTVWGGFGNAFDLASARVITPVALQNSLEANMDSRIDYMKSLYQANPDINIKTH